MITECLLFQHHETTVGCLPLSGLCKFGKVSQSNCNNEGVHCQQWPNEKLTIFLKYLTSANLGIEENDMNSTLDDPDVIFQRIEIFCRIHS